MSKLKPIEAGCMAVITKGVHIGMFVNVSSYIGRIPNYAGVDYLFI